MQGDPMQLMNALAPTFATVDPNPIVSASTLDEMLRRSPSFIVSSFAAAFASGVAVLGLMLDTMGMRIYSTVSYIVVLRTREVGIRIAIGAQKRDILRLILRSSMRPVFAGLLVGAVAAAGVSQLLRGLLFGVHSIDGVSTVTVLFLFFTLHF
jgi:ABC-type antimicrobial peptide transport system permease subunit